MRTKHIKEETGRQGPRIIHAEQSLTIAELVIAAAILILAVTGILVSYIRALELNEIARNFSVATKLAMNKMEEIRSTPFAQIKASFDNVSFVPAGINGRGVSYVDDTNPDLLLIAVSVSWRTRNGRVYGEDKNLNGQRDVGEDLNGNNRLDSPTQLVSYFFER